MAYANIVNQACTNKQEVFARFRDFLCKRNGTYDYSTTGIGWTLWDSSYAVDEDNTQVNDWFVIYSPGETGDDDIYIKITWTNGYIIWAGYLAWDPSTHAGTTSFHWANGANIIMAEAMGNTQPIYIYGDLNMIAFVWENTSTVDYGSWIGKVQPMYEFIVPTTLTTNTGALTAGSDVVIGFASTIPDTWIVGNDLYIRTTHTNDISTSKLEQVRVKARTTTSITVDLVDSYTTDSKISDMIGLIGNATNQIESTQNTLITPGGVVNKQAALLTYLLGMSTSYHDPGAYNDYVGIYRYIIHSVTGVLGYMENIARLPAFNAEFARHDVLTEADGTSWRCFYMYSGDPIAFKEV